MDRRVDDNWVVIKNLILVRKIAELEGHTDRVTSIVVVPVAAPASKFMDYCWTSSLDGMICYWDFSVPELIKKVKVELPIFSMVSRFFCSFMPSLLYLFEAL